MRIRRVVAGTAAGLLLALASAALGPAVPAVADVTVSPTEVAQGDSARLTFRITNDSTTASVTKVVITMPADNPIPEITPLSVPDWAPAISMRKLDRPIVGTHGGSTDQVVAAITWTAVSGRETKPGQAAELPMAAGPFPGVAEMRFGVEQTYSDKTVVRWIGSASEQHPAAILKLVPAAAPPTIAAQAEAVPVEEDDSLIPWGIGIFVGALLLAGMLLLAQNRRTVGTRGG